MTIINGIEIDIIRYRKNHIKEAIENNDAIENKLHVICVVSNPCLFAKRYILMREFLHRLELEDNNIIVYVVELAYKNQEFIITDKKNKRHLQLRTHVPIWHKENMINLGVKYLLPKNYKAFAWIDADIEFESPTWAMDTLKILNGSCDVVQIWSHCVDMNNNEFTMKMHNSAGYQYSKGKQYCNTGQNYWHPGFAWAITRKAYEKMGGLYELGILGSGDNIMMLSLLGYGHKAVNENSTDDYINNILEYQDKVKKFRFGYVPGVIRHYYHGSKKNRKYQERWEILLKYDYSPTLHIQKDSVGLIIPTKLFPEELKIEIYNYFKERNEDET
jgi:hypothetical protein